MLFYRPPYGGQTAQCGSPNCRALLKAGRSKHYYIFCTEGRSDWPKKHLALKQDGGRSHPRREGWISGVREAENWFISASNFDNRVVEDRCNCSGQNLPLCRKFLPNEPLPRWAGAPLPSFEAGRKKVALARAKPSPQRTQTIFSCFFQKNSLLLYFKLL